MNFTTTSTVGIDTIIKSIQEDLYNALIDVWVDDIDGYGRVYRTETDNKVVARYYISENDYKDVYYNDNKSGQFFFITSSDSKTDDEFVFQNEIKVVFMINLNKTVGSGRRDEQARLDVVRVLRDNSFNRYEITGIETGVKNVFIGFDSEKVKNADINPLHTFCVKIKARYYINNKCD